MSSELKAPETVGEINAFLRAGKSHPGRRAAKNGEHGQLFAQIEERLPGIHKIEHITSESGVCGMWREMAADYYALLTTGKPRAVEEMHGMVS